MFPDLTSLCTRGSARQTSTKRRLDQPMLERLIPYLRPYHAVLGRSFTALKPPASSPADTRRTSLGAWATTKACVGAGAWMGTDDMGTRAWHMGKAERLLERQIRQSVVFTPQSKKTQWLQSYGIRDKHGPKASSTGERPKGKERRLHRMSQRTPLFSPTLAGSL
jgi:hypothetical protein